MALTKYIHLLSLLTAASADVYMHNPRGSNDRNCERNVNRNNGNRVFDSQNNAKGGYACPRAVGGPEMQNEMGESKFYDIDSSTGQTIEFVQDKRVYYYEGSVLPIEWTNQHGCGSNAKTTCEIVLQYACEDTLDPKVDNFWPWVANKAESSTAYYGKQHFRSGEDIGAPRDGIPRDSQDAATDTIPDNEASAIASSVETRRFGMHESYDSYQVCQRTERNKGLYTADQRLRRNDRRGTRQNPNGNRNGLECPEERDYYPWWAPSPWVDIAVLTDSATNDLCYYSNVGGCSDRCLYYLSNTMNYNKKGYCDVNHNDPAASVQTKLNHPLWQQRRWFNNKEACTAPENNFTWYEVSHDDNMVIDRDSFVCAKTQFSRVNQLGNGHADDTVESRSVGVTADHSVVHGVNANRFMWEVPKIPANRSNDYFDDMKSAYKSCTMRIRYNISTADFQQWPEDANSPGADQMVDSRNNSKSSDDTNSPLLQDPYVYVGAGDLENHVDKFVSLAVNTNQYGRTFQDRSFSFSIKPFPTQDAAVNTQKDTPAVDAARMATSINTNGGKLYNVNVRGKRGNIVQTYPSVEYDFVPNALALDTNDMIHFQWTGSDYNPRRGCNNGEGGPPDANDFVSDANTNKNSRADRSNIVMLDSMAQNVPKDYLGYDPADDTLTHAEKIELSKTTLLANAPCYDPSSDDAATRDECYALLMRMAYLNQQLDGGALVVRDGRQCLTEEELDAMSSRERAQNHPLNCAKMNAKPFPYFDAGIMWLSKNGWFPFFSSRNNNFSNRDQTGILCVGSCPVDANTGVLNDQNPSVTGAAMSRVSATVCVDTISDGDGANNNGATSCISSDGEDDILGLETFFNQEGDNDSKGDGNEQGCEVLTYDLSNVDTIEEKVTLAIILLFVGLFTAWLGYFCYNRYKLSQAGEGVHRRDTKWTKTHENEVL